MNAPGLSFHNLPWLPAVLALLALAVGATLLAYRRSDPGLRSPLGLGLKLAGFAILALALLEPSWSRDKPRPGANFFLLLADSSQSLRLADRGTGASRGELQRKLLAGRPAWLAPLAADFQLRRYRFDARLERVTDYETLPSDGPSSNLGSALRALAERYRGAPLAGLLLFSDGNATDLGGALGDLKGLPPIFPVVSGVAEQDAPTDVALAELTASQTLFEDAPVTIDGKVETAGQRGRPLTVELRDDKNQLVAQQRLTPSGDPQTLTVRFQVRPSTAGLIPYRVTVSGGRDEATPLNNSRLVLVERPSGPSRVLYVGGRPNWEYKFVRRALEGDRQLELAALIRMAPREPKFAFLTRRGETHNPLYRGFGASADDAERFDEPVLVRLGTRDDKELRAGFPKSPEELFEFRALIIDDLEAAFFSADQKALIERFVTERGGGLLMLGGSGSFRAGAYARTPIGELLPVHLDRLPAVGNGRDQAMPAPVRLTLTREGWLEAWTRLRDNEAAERARLDAMPAFKVLSRTGALKPAATVLATAQPSAGDGAVSYPVLVAQRAGEGRAAVITVGDLWRWGLRRSPGEADDLAKFWRQTLRFLVSDVPAPITLTLDPAAAEPGAFRVRVRARGRDYRPADGATVQLEAQDPGGKKLSLTAEPTSNEPGVYEALYRPSGTGLHRLMARAIDGEGKPLGQAEAGLPLDLLADEHRSIRPNLPLLQALAQGTGGQLVPAADLERFTRSLGDRPAPVRDLETRPLWHSWLVLLLALACFAGEWALRRTRGLP